MSEPVVNLAVERYLRRGGDGWPLLEAELTEVPPLELAVVRDEVRESDEQLSLFDRRRR